MPSTGFGKVINNPNCLATIIWSMIDSKMSAQGVEMSTTPWITLYTMRVNIMQIVLSLCLVWLMSSGRSTILEDMTAAHVHALHRMWQRLQLSNIPHHKHMEYVRLKDTCTVCWNVYNTQDNILHHMCKHNVTVVFNLCVLWLTTSKWNMIDSQTPSWGVVLSFKKIQRPIVYKKCSN